MAAETGLQTDVWVCPGVWIPNRGYTQVFEYARAFGSPNGATYRRLDPQPRLHTGVWSPNRGYTQVSGVPNRSYTQVFGVPGGRSCKLPIGSGELSSCMLSIGLGSNCERGKGGRPLASNGFGSEANAKHS